MHAPCAYDSTQDPHLAAFYARHSVRKQLQRSAIAERIQRRPAYLQQFASYLGGSVLTQDCGERSAAARRFMSLGERHIAPSPLSPLLAEVVSRLQSSTPTNDPVRSRSSSACETRPAAESRCSSRLSGPPSRPSSAGPARRPVARSRHAAPSTTLPSAPPSPYAAKHRDPATHHSRRVKFEDVSKIPPGAENADGDILASHMRGRRRAEATSGLADFLAADSFDNVFVPHHPDEAVTAVGGSQQAEHIRVSRDRTVTADPDGGEQRATVTNHNEPKTFILLRFTIDQFLAAGKIQQWYRGVSVRRRMKLQRASACRIQRAFRRFRVACRTAFAVWMLEKDNRGKWHPTSKFAQFSQRPSSARVRFGASHRRDNQQCTSSSSSSSPPPLPEAYDYTPRDQSLVDFHGNVICSLGNVMALFVREPQDRIAIVEQAAGEARSLAQHFVVELERILRQQLEKKQQSRRLSLSKGATSSVRRLQARRSAQLLQDAGRQQVVAAESTQRMKLHLYFESIRSCAVESTSHAALQDNAQSSVMDLMRECLAVSACVHRCAVEVTEQVEWEQLCRQGIIESELTAVQSILCDLETTERDRIALEELSVNVVLEEKLLVMQEIRKTVVCIVEAASGQEVGTK